MSQKMKALLCAGLAVILLAVLAVLLATPRQSRKAGAAENASDEILQAQATELPDAPEVTPNSNPFVEISDDPAADGYFADALFIGDKLVKGLQLNDYDNILAGADFITGTGEDEEDELTVTGGTAFLDDLEYDVYGKVYICLGTEELRSDDDVIKASYTSLINEIRRHEPNAIIYIMSLPPISKYRCDSSYSYSLELLQEFNNNLRALARENGAYFLNIYSALCDEDGYLPSDVTEDGIHFTPAHYSGWFEYLRTHYVTDDTEDWDE